MDILDIQYQNNLYIEITHDEQLVKINEEVNGHWCNDKEVVLKDTIKFPFVEYWIPEIMFECLEYSENGKYDTTYGLSGQNKIYRRISE